MLGVIHGEFRTYIVMVEQNVLSYGFTPGPTYPSRPVLVYQRIVRQNLFCFALQKPFSPSS
jgi:hypothetical protein